ncbi:MAG: hypothetical protein ACK2UO_16890 [Caldilineaceae bacterium]
MAETIPLVVHSTHEAGVKLGGIGAVLDGLLSADEYVRNVQRTVLVGPMLAGDQTHMERFFDPRNGVTVHYSSLHGIFNVSEEIRSGLQRVEQLYSVGLLYGVRRFGAYEHEIILVDVTSPNWDEVNLFKYYTWQHTGFDAARYSYDPEFNLFFIIAPPIFGALKAVGCDAGLGANEKFIIAHEWMGMALVFASDQWEPGQWRTIFYAHEMATARRLIEDHDGHDTRFYNALYKAKEWNLGIEAVFGNQDHLYKHALLKQVGRCDNIFAVGDLVVDELRFLGGPLHDANIDLVYNGIVASDATLEEKQYSKSRLQRYCQNLLGYAPDYVFTHVTRMVLSKALWRDLRVLEHLDGLLAQIDKRAVVFMLTTSVPAGRRPEWVWAWEEQYGWPVGHRGDNGDLVDEEAPFFFDAIEPFNRYAKQSQVVFVNQFGWSRERCGRRMPSDMEFLDIRRGSDVEFGQSIYEPFGIAQVEPLTYGAISCVSNVCGCNGFVARAAGAKGTPNLVIADYVTLPYGYWLDSPYDALGIDRGVRDWIEGSNSGSAAQEVFDRLPKNGADSASLLDTGQTIAANMSWDVVARDMFLPGLRRAMK